MKKVAKLVTVSTVVRVIVDENATQEQIYEKAMPQIINSLVSDGIFDHLESIKDDTEMPYMEPAEEHTIPFDFSNLDIMKFLREECPKFMGGKPTKSE